MRMPMTTIPTLTLLVAGLWMACPAGAAEGTAHRDSLLKSLPAAVQQTVRAQAEGCTIRDIGRETGEDGKPVYEVEMMMNGLSKDIIVGMDGALLISEQQVPMAQLPPAVRATLVKSAGSRKIRIVESVTRNGALAYYEAQVLSGKKVAEIKVGVDGKLVR